MFVHLLNGASITNSAYVYVEPSLNCKTLELKERNCRAKQQYSL